MFQILRRLATKEEASSLLQNPPEGYIRLRPTDPNMPPMDIYLNPDDGQYIKVASVPEGPYQITATQYAVGVFEKNIKRR